MRQEKAIFIVFQRHGVWDSEHVGQLPVSLDSIVGVVISQDNIEIAFQLLDARNAVIQIAQCQIAQNINDVIFRDYRIPVCYDCPVVIFDSIKAPRLKQEFFIMAEMQIRSNVNHFTCFPRE